MDLECDLNIGLENVYLIHLPSLYEIVVRSYLILGGDYHTYKNNLMTQSCMMGYNIIFDTLMSLGVVVRVWDIKCAIYNNSEYIINYILDHDTERLFVVFYRYRHPVTSV